jgi:hypothetical protein
MENKELYIKLDDFERIISKESNKIVGKVMKRFEVISDHTILKAETKELLYESMRDIKDIIVAYGMGKEAIKIDFKK